MPTRILAIDYGLKRTGLALADDELRLAVPAGAIVTASRQAVVDEVVALIEREEVGQVVVGLPLNMDGGTGPMVDAAMWLADAIRERTGLPVDLFDERLTSHAAEGRLAAWEELTKKRRRKRVDALAATILLQSYLDSAQPPASNLKP